MNKTYRRLVIITVTLALLIVFWGLGTISLISLNEGRRALAIKEMFASGNWLLPTLNGELYLTKPPLLYWISLVFSNLLGVVNEWTLRLPSALAALATLWMTYRYTLKKFGAWPALFSAQILMVNLGFAMLARRAEIEMLLTALCVGALLSIFEYIAQPAKKGWVYLSYFLLALAVLTKGPVALLFVTLPLIVALVVTRDASVRQSLTDYRAWMIFLVIALSWYLAVSLQLGFDIWATIAKRDMLEKMQADEVAKPLLSYVGWIIVDFLFIVGLIFVRFRSLWQGIANRRDCLVLVTAVVVPLLVFSLFSNKHAKYLLPIYPLVSIVLGVHLANIYELSGIRVKRLILLLGLLLPAVLTGFYMFVEAHVFSYRTAAFSQFHDWNQHVDSDALYAYGKTDSRLIYYAKTAIPNIEAAELEQLRIDKKPFLVLVEDDEADKVSALTDCKVREFTPYLKKKKSLIVFGAGTACHHQQGQ